MLSGQESPDHGARSNGDEVVAGLPWVPEILARQGWRTRALVSASVLDATVGFDRGFHDFDSTFERRRIRGHGLLSFLGFRPHKGSARHRPGAGTLALLDDLAPGHRTFTWIHLYDAHWPYEPGAEAAARHGLQDPTPLPAVLGGPFAGVREEQLTTALVDRGKRLYRAGIDELDQLVGALLATVPCDTTVVVVGDHGESLDEHGYHFSHGRYPYAPDARVPLLVRAAGWEPRSVETVVSLVDVAPTLLELAGLPAPPSMPGRSLAHPVERPAVTHCYATGFREPMDDDGDVEPEAGAALGPFGGIAVREGRWSAVQVRGRPTALFDRSVDPRELDPLPLPADHPLAVRLRAEAARTGEEPKELDEATREMLRALGYVE
jgi:arylsulfatase A-like enzyme